MRAWIIGSGGLLGHAITRETAIRMQQATSPVFLHSPAPVPWGDETEAISVLEQEVAKFAAALDGGLWAIIWAAGSSIVASDEHQTELELRIFSALSRSISMQLPPSRGIFFVASSAGGIYAGGVTPPFSASSDPAPISPYGRLKLEQEKTAIEVCAPMCRVLIGRFSNLYGPAHDKQKQQGLIQRLCLATMQRKAINLYVSMDTVRDYLFVADAARLVWDAIANSEQSLSTGVEVLLLASGEMASIAEVIATVQTVTHRRVPLALGTDLSSDRQPIDLRFIPSLSAKQTSCLTPLPIGIRRVFDAFLGGSA